MKCVEQGLITLDTNILEHVPELAKQPVYVFPFVVSVSCTFRGSNFGWKDSRQPTNEPGKYSFSPRQEPITLRMLMTNTAGVGYPPGELSYPEALEDLATGKEPWAQAKVVRLLLNRKDTVAKAVSANNLGHVGIPRGRTPEISTWREVGIWRAFLPYFYLSTRALIMSLLSRGVWSGPAVFSNLSQAEG